MTDPLITPERAKEIKREAVRHASKILAVALGEWDAREYVRSDAEEELLKDEVQRISDELRRQSIVGTYQPCPECGLLYRVKADLTMHRHHGMDPAGFSTGEPCPGVGLTPAP